jgi:hypothetical protein
MAVHLQFEGIRCFSEPQDAVIRPLTLLVGENSSGKTTFLALCRIAHAIANGAVRNPRFNEDPFWLGAFEQIASHRGDRNGSAKTIAVTIRLDAPNSHCSLRAEYMSRYGQPSPCLWRLEAGGLSIQATNEDEPPGGAVLLQGPNGTSEHAFEGILSFDFVTLQTHYLYVLADAISGSNSALSRSHFEALARAWQDIKGVLPYPYAFAPIRTSPRRTYDPIGVDVKPEGSHVPMLLAALSRSPQIAQWEVLQSVLGSLARGPVFLTGLKSSTRAIRKAIRSRSG